MLYVYKYEYHYLILNATTPYFIEHVSADISSHDTITITVCSTIDSNRK